MKGKYTSKSEIKRIAVQNPGRLALDLLSLQQKASVYRAALDQMIKEYKAGVDAEEYAVLCNELAHEAVRLADEGATHLSSHPRPESPPKAR